MSSTLPLQPNLEHLKRQAKDLLKAHQRGDTAVCATMRQLRHLTHAADAEILATPLTLRQAQHALAKAYGFANWADLKAAVETTITNNTITGRCHCGAIRYDAQYPVVKSSNCTCWGCQKATGTFQAPFVTVKRTGFTITAGEPSRFRANSGDRCDAHGEWFFCSQCGSQVFWKGDGGDDVDIFAGTLDDTGLFQL